MSCQAQAQNSSFYIVKCRVHGLFLGVEGKPRAGSVETARKFNSREEAEAQALELRARCRLFELPWIVEELAPKQGGAA